MTEFLFHNINWVMPLLLVVSAFSAYRVVVTSMRGNIWRDE